MEENTVSSVDSQERQRQNVVHRTEESPRHQSGAEKYDLIQLSPTKPYDNENEAKGPSETHNNEDGNISQISPQPQMHHSVTSLNKSQTYGGAAASSTTPANNLSNPMLSTLGSNQQLKTRGGQLSWIKKLPRVPSPLGKMKPLNQSQLEMQSNLSDAMAASNSRQVQQQNHLNISM